MKSLFNEKGRILISLDDITCGVDLLEKYHELRIYKINEKNNLKRILESENVIDYLDRFIIVLPIRYNMQRILWTAFYHRFGENYQTLIDETINLRCIQFMLEYVNKKLELSMSSKILDYGCGNGISIRSECAGEIIGYEPVEVMRHQAEENGMQVLGKGGIKNIPDNYFDAVFSSYVFHMAINEEDIKQIISKVKENAIIVANFYKGINQEYVNSIFIKCGFDITRISTEEERYGFMYEYRRKECK